MKPPLIPAVSISTVILAAGLLPAPAWQLQQNKCCIPAHPGSGPPTQTCSTSTCFTNPTCNGYACNSVAGRCVTSQADTCFNSGKSKVPGDEYECTDTTSGCPIFEAKCFWKPTGQTCEPNLQDCSGQGCV